MANEREITIKLAAKNLTSAEFAKARAEILGLGAASDKASSSSLNLSHSFKSIAAGFGAVAAGSAIFAAIKGGLSSVVGGAFEMNASLEKSQLQFTTLMGDADKAQAHVKGLFDFAKKTPFETGPIINASLKLQTFGGAALNTMANLTLLGDASAATGAPIEDLGFWVGRLYASLKGGQPFGESAMRLQELAVLTPSARAEMEALQKAGKSAEEIFGVFQGRLGEFGGAMVAQANTWDGLKSSIGDAVSIMMADSLKPLFDMVKMGAQMTLELLGSNGMERAFTSARDAIRGAFGSGPDGGQGLVKNFIDGLLVAVDYGIVGAQLMMRAFSGLKLVFFGAASAAGALALGFLNLVEAASTAASKLPGIGDSFRGIAAEVSLTRQAYETSQKAFHDQAEAAWEGVKGNGALAQSLDVASNTIQAMRAELSKTTIAVSDHEKATRSAGSAKGEFVAQTKAEEAAERTRAAGLKKLTAEIEKFGRESMNLGEQIKKGVFGEFTTQLEDTVSLQGRSTEATGRMTAELEKWAQTHGAVFSPAIKQMGRELDETAEKSTKSGSLLSKSFADVPKAIMSALQGGGNVGKSVGASIFGNMFSAESDITKSITSKMSGLLKSGIGEAIGAVVPGLGTLLGSQLGSIAGTAFGKIFKSEGKKVNDMRDGFVSAAGGIHELNVKAQAAGLTLDRLLKAKNVKDYQAAVEELNAAFGKSEADMELARQAMDEWGISASDAGQKFAQADMDKTAGSMLAKLKAATAAGVDLNAIVTKGGDDFGKMVHQAIRSGTTISNEFRPVLAAMIENKSLVDENGEAFTDLSQIPFADDIGGGLKEVATSLKELAAYFMGGMTSAFKTAGDKGVDFANRVNAGIAGIPRSIEIEVNGTYTPPSIEGGGQGYDVGTMGRHGQWFTRFADGDGTQVRVHGEEAILTRAQVPDFVMDHLSSVGLTARGAAAPTVNVYTVVDLDASGRPQQQVVSKTEYLRRQMQALMRSGAVQVPQTSIVGAM